MHHAEQFKPSSTGHLIQRVIEPARTHIYRRGTPVRAEDLIQPGKELWVLHPKGDPLPADVSPDNVQVLLLDGNWAQASEMMQAVGGIGRKVNLPMQGASRYWLREQQGAGLFSTVEALLFLLEAFGLTETHRQLRLQMELHVYAGLCTRGKKIEAYNYLADSPVRTAFPGIVEKFLVGGLK